MVPTAGEEPLGLNSRCCAPSRRLLAGPSARQSPTSCSRRDDWQDRSPHEHRRECLLT